ncbi:MAG: hypothetical protein ACLFPG_09730 [Desulfohalobiaceae bacterium]
MKCPGQDSRYWDQKAIYEVKCPKCQAQVEFFKDESRRKCPSCGEQFLNPELDLGCAAYCKFAEQCLGELSPDIQAKRNELLKDKIAVQAKKSLGRDFQAVARTSKMAEYAKKILFQENADPAVVLTAAYLETIVSKQGLEKAREILKDQGASQELLQEVLDGLQELFSGKDADSANLRVLQDAMLLTDMQSKDFAIAKDLDLVRDFKTEAGRALAREIQTQK